jgi:hypothetical protein
MIVRWLVALWLSTAVLTAQTPKPRVIVLTDISNEPDDEESLVRYLVYSNEFDTEGIIATTSVWLREKIRPDIIRESINAYGQVRENLLLHAPGYPTTNYLLGVTKSGLPEFGMKGVGAGKTSEGSRHIIEVVDKPDPRPVWVLVWGGPNCLAQALWDVKYTRSAEELERFVAKLRVYAISDQDDSGRWMRITFSDLFYIVSPTDVERPEYDLATWNGISGDRQYKNGPMENFELVDNPWLEENIIRNHGPLGSRYPRLAYIMEGDTPSFLNLIPNGLAGDVEPSYGGWGGRYELRRSYAETRPIWTNSRDTVKLKDGKDYTSNQATIWRWREAYQHDFAARMDWCVMPRDRANHNPLLSVNGKSGVAPVQMAARAGETVRLSAAGSADPDGHKLTYKWFHYREAGTLPAAISIDTPSAPEIALRIPQVDQPRTAHIILQVTDDGTPRLYAYRRVILTIKP